MAEATNDWSGLVTATANRLRLMQAELADDPPEIRKKHLSEAVAQAMKDIVPDGRNDFLRGLLELFPSWDINEAVSAQATDAIAAPEFDANELNDPAFLVTQLAKLAPTLSDEQRAAVQAGLRDAGLLPPPTTAWSEDEERKLRAALELKDQVAISPDRLMQAMPALVSFASSLDQFIWNTWDNVAHAGTIKPPAEWKGARLSNVLKRFVAGDPKISVDQINALRYVSRLVVAFVSSVSLAGTQFAKRHQTRFSPSAIKAIVEAEGTGGIFTAKEVTYWKKYVELCERWNASAIEAEITDGVVKYVEQLMKGVGLGNSGRD